MNADARKCYRTLSQTGIFLTGSFCFQKSKRRQNAWSVELMSPSLDNNRYPHQKSRTGLVSSHRPSHFDAIQWKGAAVVYVAACFGKRHPHLLDICLALRFRAIGGLFVAIAFRVER
jgi:hypothetical protein